MPTIATQTSPVISRRTSYVDVSTGQYTPPPTPPESPQHACSAPESPTASIRNVHVSRQARMSGSKRAVPFNLYVDGIHLNMPQVAASAAAPKPQMKSIGVQAGEPQVPLMKAGPWKRRWLAFWSTMRPVLKILMIVPMFFIERTGFGINLNGLFTARNL